MIWYSHHQQFIKEIQKQLDEQRDELQSRAETISALQRNFDAISHLCQDLKTLNNTLTDEKTKSDKENSTLVKDVASLRKKLTNGEKELEELKKWKLLNDNTKTFEELKVSNEKKEQALKKNNAQLESTRNQLKSAAYDLDKSKKEINKLQRDYTQLAMNTAAKEEEIKSLEVHF